MIKINLPLLSLIFLCYSSNYAQPILNNSVFPIIGDVIEYDYLSSGQSLMPGNAGANTTWDFSNLMLDGSISSVSYVDPFTTPYYNFFPASNMAVFYSNNQIKYLKRTADSLILHGQYVTGINDQLYYNTRLNLKAPLNFGEVFTDDFATNFTNPNGDFIIRTGTVQSTFDAYGTLKLPNHIIPNCIRIKTATYSHDIIGSSSADYYDTSYHWYSPNVRDYILYFYSSTFSGTPYSYGYLRTNFQLALNEIEQVENTLTISPNPSSETITISYSKEDKTDETCFIFDINGREIKQLTVEQTKSLVDISALNAGIYFVRLGNNLEKFVKE